MSSLDAILQRQFGMEVLLTPSHLLLHDILKMVNKDSAKSYSHMSIFVKLPALVLFERSFLSNYFIIFSRGIFFILARHKKQFL